MKNKKIYIIFLILIIIFSASLTEKTFQNDTYALIALGRDEVINPLNGYDHLTFHEGLKSANTAIVFNILMYVIYSIGKEIGIYFFVMILSVINGIFIFNFIRNKINNMTISFILSMFTIYFIKFYFTARPTIIVIPFIILIFQNIEKILQEGKKKNIVFLIISSYILLNLHTFIWLLHFIFYLPYIAEQVLSKFKISQKIKNKIIIENNPNFKVLLIALGLDILCIVFSPYIITVDLLIKDLINTLTGELQISELSNTNIFTSIYSMIILLVFGGIFFTKEKIKISDIFIIIGLTILEIIGYRFSIYLYIFGTKIINSYLNIFMNSSNLNLEKLDEFMNKNINLIIVILIVLMYSIKNFKDKVNDIFVEGYPVKICEYIEKNYNKEEMRVYNEFNYGAYLEFKQIPNFIDGRAGTYYQKYGDTTIVEDFLAISDIKNYEELFKKYNITHLLLYSGSEINKAIYKDIQNYKLIYQEEEYCFYEVNL